MPYTRSQIKRILDANGKPVIAPSNKLPLAVRVSESLIRRNLYSLEDQTVMDQADAYNAAFRAIRNHASDLAEHYGVSKLDSSPKAHALIDQLATFAASQVVTLRRRIPDIAYQATVNAYELAYYGRLWVTQESLPRGIRLNTPRPGNIGGKVAHLKVAEALSDEALRALLGRKPFDSAFEVDIDALLPDVRRALNTAMANGEGIPDAMRRVRAALGIETDRRSGYRANFNRVQTTTRTYILDASNQAAKAAYEANSDILDGWTWLTAHDDRVCPDCAPMDGQEFPMDDDNVPPLHPNCRCTCIPRIKDTIAGGDYGEPPAADAPPDSTFQDWLIGIGLGYLFNKWFGSNTQTGQLDSSQVGA